MKGSPKVFLTTLVAIGCGLDTPTGTDHDLLPPVLTYEEFAAKAWVEPRTGLRIMNGDEPVLSENDLFAMYRGYLRSVADVLDRADGIAKVTSPLIINLLGPDGPDDKWSASQARKLTYCIDKKSFGPNYKTFVKAMHEAAEDWEQAANVKFIHLDSYDKDCGPHTSSVLFNVFFDPEATYLARAFFPHWPRHDREVVISPFAFEPEAIAPITLPGVVRHELGHALGFRHEHTRPESGDPLCFEDSEWRVLTKYDIASVMHYPWCGSATWADLVLTDLDRKGARKVYPFK